MSETGPASGPGAKAKEAVGRHAAGIVRDGTRVGLGTGSTVYYTILELAERALEITCIGTSDKTEALARERGLHVVTPGEIGSLDIAIDGADEVDPSMNLVKGGGGALTREKIVAELAEEFIVVVDRSKLVDKLGRFGLPFEVLEFGVEPVRRRLLALGAQDVTVRDTASDNGNRLLDADFFPIDEPAALGRSCHEIPGVIEHGIFPSAVVDRVCVAHEDGVQEMYPRGSAAD